MRLSCGVFNDGGSLGTCCSYDHIDRRAHGHLVKKQVSGMQPVWRFRLQIAAVHVDLRAQGAEAFDMLVNRSDAEIAAAGTSDICAAEAPQLGAHDIIRTAHFSDKIVRGRTAPHMTGIDRDGVFIQPLYSRPHALQDLKGV